MIIFCFIIYGCNNSRIINPKGYTTENIILVTLDGVRWEEVFTGADPNIINNDTLVVDVEETNKNYWHDNDIQRRKKLMPFLWSTIYQSGQIYGNKLKGSSMELTNSYFFSYPGYSELLTGFSDDSVNSNNKKYNPNKNVLEFMNEKDGFRNAVAAFASWDVFDWIINNQRNSFTINSGAYPLEDKRITVKQRWMNSFISEIPYPGYGRGVRWDVFTYEYAFEYLKLNKPRILYIGFDETDGFAHDTKYDKYLYGINRLDRYIEDLWTWIQSNEKYKNKTTMIITTDHGRGKYKNNKWGSHGSSIPNSKYTWAGIIGPDTPPKGEIIQSNTIYMNQVAATITHLLGYDYSTNEEAGTVIYNMIAN